MQSDSKQCIFRAIFDELSPIILVCTIIYIGEKSDVSLADVATTVSALLNTIHDALFAAAKKGRDDKLVTVTKWEDFVPALEKQCLVMTPFCDQKEWEEKVKVRPARSQKMA